MIGVSDAGCDGITAETRERAMATKGRTPKHPKPHKNVRNEERPNGKAWKKSAKSKAARLKSQ